MQIKILFWILYFMIADVGWANEAGVSYRDGKDNFVAQVFEQNGQQIAILNVRNRNFGQKGTLLNTYRWARTNDSTESVKVKTGEIKITSNDAGLVVAAVTQKSTGLNSAMYRKYAGVMAGDEIEVKNVQIVPKTIVSPELTIPYNELFANPSRFNQNFELSEQGMSELERVAETFGRHRSHKLIIEGHTDSVGDSTDNQVESLQRAIAIKHILVDKFGFDSGRLIALGFGETEPVDEVYYPGIENVNRRIVFRISHE